MLELMRLEMRKFPVGPYIRAAALANVVVLALICLVSIFGEVKEALSHYGMAFTLIDTIMRGIYIVFAAVLLSRIIIDEFRSRTITLLFMYPINRKKLLAAKLLIVVLFTLCAIFAGNLFVGIGFYVFNLVTPIVPEPITVSVAAQSLITMGMSALATSFLSLIPLFFGMRKHSIAATILSSLIVVMLVCQNVDGFSLYSVIAVPISLALLGISVAYMSIRHIKHADV
ncbi:ABC transporter permease [Paenibacillus residui]|uniref:ABC transporter permease n=1 Tax=Paenibacillus residui TaxID=629724 RepID=A0ABW3D8W1_9BACL|nr:ABC transporter permease [Aneurinibacillus sp. XH2]